MAVEPGRSYDETIALSDAELEKQLDGLVYKVDVYDETSPMISGR
jgi:hypothetical protein